MSFDGLTCIFCFNFALIFAYLCGIFAEFFLVLCMMSFPFVVGCFSIRRCVSLDVSVPWCFLCDRAVMAYICDA